MFVEPGQQFGGVLGAQCGRAQHRPDLTHRLGGLQAVSDDVADDQADRAGGQGEYVVPVTADLAAVAGDVAGGELQPRYVGRLGREQCALQDRRGGPLGSGHARLGCRGGAVGDHLEQLGVLFGEHAGGQGADVQDTQHGSAGQQRHAQQRGDALLPQDGVEHVAVIDVVDRDPMPFLGDAPREAAAERDPYALVDLFLDAPGGGGDEELTGGIQQQHRGGVDRHQLADLVEQLVEQPVHGQLGQPGVGDRLKPPQPLLRRARRCDLHRHSTTLTAGATTAYA